MLDMCVIHFEGARVCEEKQFISEESEQRVVCYDKYLRNDHQMVSLYVHA